MYLTRWLRGDSIPDLVATISEIGYMYPLFPSRDMAEISLMKRTSSNKPTNQRDDFFFVFY